MFRRASEYTALSSLNFTPLLHCPPARSASATAQGIESPARTATPASFDGDLSRCKLELAAQLDRIFGLSVADEREMLAFEVPEEIIPRYLLNIRFTRVGEMNHENTRGAAARSAGRCGTSTASLDPLANPFGVGHAESLPALPDRGCNRDGRTSSSGGAQNGSRHLPSG